MNLFGALAGWLAEGESLALATIVSRSGSAPRAAGSRLVIRPDGSIAGTIGGGILEARVLEQAKAVFGHGRAVLHKYTLTPQDASLTGMVCGGRVQILLQYLDASRPENLDLYRALAAVSETRKQAWLITAVPSPIGLAIGAETPEEIAVSIAAELIQARAARKDR